MADPHDDSYEKMREMRTGWYNVAAPPVAYKGQVLGHGTALKDLSQVKEEIFEAHSVWIALLEKHGVTWHDLVTAERARVVELLNAFSTLVYMKHPFLEAEFEKLMRKIEKP